MFKRLRNLKEYYELLGCNDNYPMQMISCEICSNSSFTTICSHTDTGNNTLTPVEVKACNKCGFMMQNPRFPEEFYNRYYDEFYPFMRARSQSNVEGDLNTIIQHSAFNKKIKDVVDNVNKSLSSIEQIRKFLSDLPRPIPLKFDSKLKKSLLLTSLFQN